MQIMDSQSRFDPLEGFAEIERLAGKVYFRFSHLFLQHPELRDFWWQMALDEEQHSATLLACKELITNYDDEAMDPSLSQEKANELKERINSYLRKGTPSITMEEAFKIALEMESSELEVIYGKLLRLGGPKIARTLGHLIVPASVQRQKLKSAVLRFSKDPGLRATVETL
ncbi:MAG: hypothetical protein V3W08_08295 [Candidatus Binatia bacterium]